MENFIVEYGMSAHSWRTMMALRILVSMSEMGSVVGIRPPTSSI
jgi:hypothetical protein